MREGEYGAVLGNQIEGGMKVAASPPFLEDAIPVSQPSPSRERCPAGADRAPAV